MHRFTPRCEIYRRGTRPQTCSFRREVGLGSECNKRNCALLSYLWLHSRGSDPVIVRANPHIGKACMFQVRLDLLRG